MDPSPGATQPALSRIPPFSFGAAFAEGWRTLRERYAMLLGVTLIYLAAMVVSGYIGQALDRLIDAPVASLALNIFLFTPLGVGAVYAAVSAVRGGNANVADLFLPFTRYWTVVGVSVLMLLASWLIAFVGGLAVFVGIVLTRASDLAWVLVVPVGIAVFVALVYIGLRLYFAPLLAIDPWGPHAGVVDSIRLSWEMTRGSTALWLFLIGICSGLIVIASAVLLLLPAIFIGVPLGLAVYAAAYAQIAADTGVAPRGWTGRCHWCGYDVSATTSNLCPECGGELPPRPAAAGAR